MWASAHTVNNLNGAFMDRKLEKYINENRVCSDWIFRDWRGFLDILFECGGAVQEILWFEYVEKGKQTLGGGGYEDPADPGYMWAETMIFDKNLGQKSLLEVSRHIESTMKSHLPHKLVPCFWDVKA